MSANQVTASRIYLLLECSRPFDPNVETVREEPTEAMRYGSAFHEVLELNAGPKDVRAIAKKWGIDATELAQHATRALLYLKKWMAGDNIWGETFRAVFKEQHLATRVSVDAQRVDSRECDFDAETHHYDLQPGEFGGTSDLVVRSSARTIVVDYKTGDFGEFHTPSKIPQMLALALQHHADGVAILHTPRGAMPVMHAETVSGEELGRFVERFELARFRIGDGSLRPGPWCTRCPARESCPAKDGELLTRASSLIKHTISREELGKPVDKGAFHMFLGELARLEKRAREVLKADVKAGEVIARPDGKVLVIREKTVESLSKSSIVEALGKAKGEKEIERLRKLGCVRSDTREELHAVDDK